MFDFFLINPNYSAESCLFHQVSFFVCLEFRVDTAVYYFVALRYYVRDLKVCM